MLETLLTNCQHGRVIFVCSYTTVTINVWATLLIPSRHLMIETTSTYSIINILAISNDIVMIILLTMFQLTPTLYAEQQLFVLLLDIRIIHRRLSFCYIHNKNKYNAGAE